MATARIHLSVEAFDPATTGLSDVTASIAELVTHTFATGTGANQVSLVWSSSGDVDTGQTDTLDLVSGGLLTGRNQAANFVRVRALMIRNTGSVVFTVGGTFAGLGGGSIPLRPGGTLLLVGPDATGYAVSGGSSDTITIANSSGSTADYEIVVLGN